MPLPPHRSGDDCKRYERGAGHRIDRWRTELSHLRSQAHAGQDEAVSVGDEMTQVETLVGQLEGPRLQLDQVRVTDVIAVRRACGTASTKC